MLTDAKDLQPGLIRQTRRIYDFPQALLLGGAGTANGEAWLRAIDPQIALMSADEVLTDTALLARLAGRNLLRTGEHGTLTPETDGRQVWVAVER